MEPIFWLIFIWVHKNATPKNWLMQVKGSKRVYLKKHMECINISKKEVVFWLNKVKSRIF